MDRVFILTICGLILWGYNSLSSEEYSVHASTDTHSTKTQHESFFKPGTIAGSYLASRYAQRQQDWSNASLFTDYVLEQDSSNLELKKRAMILAMGSGNITHAIDIAKNIIEQEEKDVLAMLFMALEAFSRSDYAQAKSILSDMPEESVTEFIRPLLLAWTHSADQKLSIEQLKDNSLHAYHAVLIADSLNKLDNSIEPFIDKALEETTIDVYELENIADIHVKMEKFQKALELYELIIKQQPNAKSVQQKIDLLEKDQDSAASAEIFILVRNAREGAAEAMFDMARILYRQYNDDSARVFAQMALHLNPEISEVKVLLANLMARYERYDDAIDHYQSVMEDSDNYIQTQRQAADFMQRAGRRPEAIDLLENIAKKYHDVESLIQIGDIYKHDKEFRKAIRAYNSASRKLGHDIPKKYWHLLYSRGTCYERIGEWNKAEKDLQAALRYQPNNPYILNYLGYSWADQGKNLDASLEMIRQAADILPQDGYIADSLGWVLFRLNKYEEAIKHLEKAVELLPYDSTINDHLGDAYWKVGRIQEAKFQWKRALNHSEDKDLSEKVAQKVRFGLTEEKLAHEDVQSKSSKNDQTAPDDTH